MSQDIVKENTCTTENHNKSVDNLGKTLEEATLANTDSSPSSSEPTLTAPISSSSSKSKERSTESVKTKASWQSQIIKKRKDKKKTDKQGKRTKMKAILSRSIHFDKKHRKESLAHGSGQSQSIRRLSTSAIHFPVHDSPHVDPNYLHSFKTENSIKKMRKRHYSVPPTIQVTPAKDDENQAAAWELMDKVKEEETGDTCDEVSKLTVRLAKLPISSVSAPCSPLITTPSIFDENVASAASSRKNKIAWSNVFTMGLMPDIKKAYKKRNLKKNIKQRNSMRSSSSPSIKVADPTNLELSPVKNMRESLSDSESNHLKEVRKTNVVYSDEEIKNSKKLSADSSFLKYLPSLDTLNSLSLRKWRKKPKDEEDESIPFPTNGSPTKVKTTFNIDSRPIFPDKSGAALGKFLKNRPPSKELVVKGILKYPEQEVQEKALRVKTVATLSRRLSLRPTSKELIERGILPLPNVYTENNNSNTTRSAPPSPTPKVQFDGVVKVGRTYPRSEYHRGAEVTWNLTPKQADKIKREINNYKKNMLVHDHSRIFTHYYK